MIYVNQQKLALGCAYGKKSQKRDNMQEMFFKLLEEQSSDKFLEIRKKISESEGYSPYSTELNDIRQCLMKKAYQRAINAYHSTFPNLLLSPIVHAMLSNAYQALKNDKMANLEKQVASLLVSFIMGTGNGTKERPYLVLRISDEYDVLTALGKERGRQELIIDQGHFLDLQKCSDETEIYFDITIPYTTL
jgi:Domain of unknown function (DUF4919)